MRPERAENRLLQQYNTQAPYFHTDYVTFKSLENEYFNMGIFKGTYRRFWGFALFCFVLALPVFGAIYINVIDFVTFMQLLMSILLFGITGIYVGFTHIIAKASEKQTDSILIQNKIGGVEKRLEKFYNPIYEILRTFRTSHINSVSVLPKAKYKALYDIFETCSYLGSKEVTKNWYSTIKNNKKIRCGDIEGLAMGAEHSPIVDYSLFNLINEERNRLIKKHKELVNEENSVEK